MTTWKWSGPITVLCTLAAAWPLLADEPAATPNPPADESITVVTSANLIPEELSETPATVTVVQPGQINAKQAFDITDVIKLAPSLSLLQTGSRGKTATLILRGANTNQTLILVDGVRINPPSQGVVDFSAIPVDNIDHIEVLRGPQSALYGSDAMGGVINIITRRGEGPLKSGAILEYGSQKTNRETYSLRGSTGKGSLSLTATRLQSDGFFTNDDFRNTGLSVRYDHPTSANSSLTLTTRLDEARTGTPGQRVVLFDPNERTKTSGWQGSLQWNHQTDQRQDKVILGWLNQKLFDNDPNNPGDPFFGTTDIKDQITNLEAHSSRSYAHHTLTGGGEVRRDKASFNIISDGMFGPFNNALSQAVTTSGLFVQDKMNVQRWTLVPGVRWEDHSRFGSNWSGRFNSSYQLTPVSRVKVNVGTGFHAPTIQQLFDPMFGNPNLKPEKSIGYELGYANDADPRTHWEVTGFINRFRGLIGNDPVTFAPVNINQARTIGLEFAVDKSLGQDWRFVLNQGILHVSSSNPGFLLRRPRFTTTADLIRQHGKWQADLGVVASGKRVDNDFAGPFSGGTGTGVTQLFPGFSRVDLTVSHTLRPGLQAYVRAQNLFNRHYEQVAGFPAPTFNFVVGIRTATF